MKTSLLLTFGFLVFLLFATPAWASYFYLTPDSTSVDSDSTVTFDIKLSTQDEVVNGVSAYLAYPHDKLDAKSVEINKALLPIVAEQTTDDNTIKLSGANLSSINGSD